MMIHIDETQVTQINKNEFAAEASTLGMKPGEWPEEIATDIGNGLPFIKKGIKVLNDEDSIDYCCYHQLLGTMTLKIFND